MSATLAIVHDPFHPQRGRELREICAGQPLSRVVPDTEQPHIVQQNGQWLLREQWCAPVCDDDAIVIVMLPQGGGGGSNPLKIILSIAISAIAMPLAQGLVMGGLVGAPTAGMITGMKLLAGGISMVGNALVNALIPPPKPPTPHQAASLSAPSPTYNLQAQGNIARLGGAIPVHYGRMLAYPDFAARPYAEYNGNEQYLYELLCIGVGEYDVEAVRIDDTPVSNWTEITYEIIPPGGTVTMFPANVVTSAEVAGQDLPTSTAIGPYVANSAGSQANYLGIDLVAPRGLYHVKTNGDLESVSAIVLIEARDIDDAGAPIGTWATLGTETMSGATTTPQRYSYRYTVTAGRYEVRVTRTDTEQTDSTYGHDLVWAGLRAYLPDTVNYGNVTLIAMRMLASSQLSAQASRKINVIATRKIPIWNGSTWSTPTATRSIAWALADAAITEGLVPESRVDLAGLLTLDSTWAGRGDNFDARFDGQVTLWEAWTQILAAGRAKPFAQGGILYAVRDQAATIPVCLFSMRNIQRGSFSLEYILPTEETADAIDVGYFDAATWSPRRVQASLPGSAAAKPVQVELFGVTDREQAYREGLYHAASNRYRRKLIRFSTEMEGFIPSPGDLIAIAHDMPQWGQTAEAVTWDNATHALTVSEPLTWTAGEVHHVGLRQRDGSLDGPIAVTQGATEYELILATAPTQTPYTGSIEERTHIVFGWGETWRQQARVVSIKPRGITDVEIEAIAEDPSVHTADSGATAPPINSSQLSTKYTAPVVAGLAARSASNNPAKMLLSWQSAAGADHYLIEQSQDGIAWTRTGETTASNYAVTALYGSATLVRVAAVGLTRGPWVQIGYGSYADYMWTTDTALMWSGGNMWKY